MKATITGIDPLSKRILLDLDRGLKVLQVPDHYPVSLDQAKKLSRFRRMLDISKGNLEKEYYERLLLLGLKSLPLSSLIKRFDWGGVMEILSVVTDETTRDDLNLLICALNEKKKKIREFKEDTNLILEQLEATNKSLHIKEKELLKLQTDMTKNVEVFNKYNQPLRSFLKEYVGFCDGQLILVKKIHTSWKQELIEQAIIVYNDDLYVYFIKDFISFTESLKTRHNRGLEYRWDQNESLIKALKADDRYRLPPEFSEPFINSLNLIKQKLLEIQHKRKLINRELQDIKSKTMLSYLELSNKSNFLSTLDLKRHKELKEMALKWLFQRGFIAVADFTLPSGKQADIFAYNESQTVIFNVKVSYEDLLADSKWKESLPYCHDYFFLTPSDLVLAVTEKIKDIDCGYFVDNGSGLKISKKDERLVNSIDQENELRFAAGQLLARKFIYGY
ncbi:MmcB family DNA repair protein [Metabacillus litoralis]|uniref:MmcB family DNA repair protein n=1 Tax=Metabacillus litoralis TaxID=152268 RepID=A0A5C6V1M9_9BACI|nr:MmcB family DNA repair protein [Metabacillus litoralis]TXC78306.1 MmcB family DNA repair protein [Metabacillus litoralis]